jgi:hypothetical protein
MKLLIEILFVCLIYETFLKGGGATTATLSTKWRCMAI